MQIQSDACTSRLQHKTSHLSAAEEDELKELAKLYGIIAKLFEELKVEAEKRWCIASKRGFNERMKTIEDLRAEYDDILEAKRRG